MEKENILESGVWELQTLREKILSLDKRKAELAKKDVEEERLEQEMKQKEKAIQDEVQMVLEKRKNEISQSFDEQLQRLRNKAKKVQAKKDKSKNQKISERIAEETRVYREENTKLHQEVKAILQQGQIPGYYNNRLFFSLFAPKGVSDYIIMVISAVIVLLMLPKFLHQFVFGGKSIFLEFLIYFVVAGIVAAGYYYVNKNTKGKDKVAIANGRAVRYHIRQNNHRIQKIKRSIKKDPDETAYGLQGFDKELKELNGEMTKVAQEKTEALLVFTNSTSHILESEIRSKHSSSLAALEEKQKELATQNKELENQVRVEMTELSKNYEGYLGKDMMNVGAIDALIRIMEQNDCDVVSQALANYRQKAEGN